LIQIKLDFEEKSKNDIIGKRKLYEYLNLKELHNSYLEKELYQIIKNSGKLNLPIDYQKFISFMAILHHGTRLERLLLIFGIFGRGIPQSEEAYKQTLKKHMIAENKNEEQSGSGDSDEEEKTMYSQTDLGSHYGDESDF
jgi:hypothetical protein